MHSPLAHPAIKHEIDDTVVGGTRAAHSSRRWTVTAQGRSAQCHEACRREETNDGKGSGQLVADVVEFTEEDLKAAIMAYAQTAPVRQQAAETSKELAKTQGELSAAKKELAETNKQLAATSQDVVDTNKRINEPDQYEPVKVVTLPFDLNSAKHHGCRQGAARRARRKGAHCQELPRGSPGLRRPHGRLRQESQAEPGPGEAVVQYLTVKHRIPLRRIMVPMGYGETKLLYTSTTASGLAKNRRVEVRVMVNKGLSQ